MLYDSVKRILLNRVKLQLYLEVKMGRKTTKIVSIAMLERWDWAIFFPSFLICAFSN